MGLASPGATNRPPMKSFCREPSRELTVVRMFLQPDFELFVSICGPGARFAIDHRHPAAIIGIHVDSEATVAPFVDIAAQHGPLFLGADAVVRNRIDRKESHTGT